MTLCEALDALLANLHLDDEETISKIERMYGIEHCVLEGLIRTSSISDWLGFERYVVAAYHHPDRSMTPVLCDVMGRQIDDLNYEDIVEVLGIIGDPSAVGCLERALLLEPPWDEDAQLAAKASWALRAIGTIDALDVLRRAARMGSEQSRSAALRELSRHPQAD